MSVNHSAVADQINETVTFTMYAVFRIQPGGAPSDVLDAVPSSVTTRGWYDLSGFRADADLLVWWHAPTVEPMQAAYRAMQASGAFVPVWSGVGVHRAAEFNRGHVPAFLAGDDPLGYICVYPFVRSYDWYLLPDDERRRMLHEHGAAARGYGDVLANTVASFALSDYEWLLAFEADELVRIVDLMRDLRATDARRHVREEVPFFTGPRVDPQMVLARLAR